MVATAATETHPDAVTITVVDDVTGEPIEGAKVTYVIYDNDLGEETMGDDDDDVVVVIVLGQYFQLRCCTYYPVVSRHLPVPQ